MMWCREPLHLNARGVAKYSDFGRIEGYILETVQDIVVKFEEINLKFGKFEKVQKKFEIHM